MKTSKRFLAVLMSMALLVTVLSSALTFTSLAEETTYAKSFVVNEPYALTDLDGNATVKLEIAQIIQGCKGVDPDRIDSTYGDFYGDYTWVTNGMKSYTIQDSENKGVSGEVIYYSEEAISDIRFDTSYSYTGNSWGEPLEFYASCDGKYFEKMDVVQELVGVWIGHNGFTDLYSQIYDKCTFSVNDDIHYVKIVSNVNRGDYSACVNRIYAVDYNVHTETVEYNYDINMANPVSVKAADGSDAALIFTSEEIIYGDVGIPNGYIIADKTTEQIINGEAVYYSVEALKNVKFDTSYPIKPENSEDSVWSNPLEFYGSSDGVTYVKLTTEKTLGVKTEHPGFPHVYDHIYDAVNFKKSDNIHYLKIKASGTNGNIYIPRIFGIDYSNYEAEKATGYAFSLDLGTPYKTYDSTGAEANYVMKATDYDGKACYNLVDSSDALVKDGYAVYKLPEGTTLANYEYRIREVNAEWGTWIIEYSRDGSNWFTKSASELANTGVPTHHKVYEATATAAEAIKFVRFHYITQQETPNAEMLPAFYFIYNVAKVIDIAPELKGTYSNIWGGGQKQSVLSTAAPFVTNSLSENAEDNQGIWDGPFTNKDDATDIIYLSFRSGMKNEGPNTKGAYQSFYFANEKSDVITSYKVRGCFTDEYLLSRQVRVFGTRTAINAENAAGSDVEWVELNTNVLGEGYFRGDHYQITDLYGEIPAEYGIKAIKVNIYNVVDINGWQVLDYYGLNGVSFNTVADDSASTFESGVVTSETAAAVISTYKNTATKTDENTKTYFAAEYANATGATVAGDDILPTYTTTTMSVGDTSFMRYRFELGELRWALEKLENVSSVTFGVLHVGVNATKEQMLTLVGREGYFTEIELDSDTSYTDNAELQVIVERTRANIGQRDTFLPYVKVMVDGQEFTYFANDVAKQSPVGWMKKVVQNIEGSAIAPKFNATIAELQQTEAYTGIDLTALMSKIAATSNQTEALAKMEAEKVGFGTQENYYALMKSLFEIVAE